MNDEKEFIDYFLKFEKDNNMFEKKIKNIKIWLYIRFNIYSSMLAILNIDNSLMKSDILQGEYKKGIKEKLKEKVFCNQNLIVHRDVLIVPHERKYKSSEGYYRCIYTDLIDSALRQSHYVLDSKSIFGDYTPQKSKNIIYVNTNRFEKKENRKRPYKKTTINEFEEKIIKPLEKFFEISLSKETKKSWKDILDNLLYRRRYLTSYYTHILNRIRPQVIMMVVAYSFDRMILCEIAKKRGIPTVEIMHGVMTRGYLPYCFPEKMKIKSFPDFIFTFGKNEYTEKLPISNRRVFPVGFPELEKYTKQKKEQKKKQILFISQGQMEIAQIAKKFSEIISDDEYDVIYKLHPKEYVSWKRDLWKYLNSTNIKVVGDFNHTIYDYLAQADWVVGIYSTVLYEATAFYTNIALLESPMSINVKMLVENGCAVMINGAEDLKKAIETKREMNTPSEEFFVKNSLYNIQDCIDHIITYYSRKRRK